MVFECTAQGSVTCVYKRNLRPLSERIGCGYAGDCVFKKELKEVKTDG